MPLSPSISPQITTTSPYLTAQATIDQLQDDFLDLDISLPSSRGNERAGKKSPRLSAVGGGGVKKGGKRKSRPREPVEGEWYVFRNLRYPPRTSTHPERMLIIYSHLLKLPVDLLQVLLSRFPPRSLSVLSATCKTLRGDLENDSIWRQSYIYHFMGVVDPKEIQVLVQPCGPEGQGWRKESLARETMLE